MDSFMTKRFNRKIHIRKRSTCEWMTFYLFLMPFLIPFFVDFLGISGLLKYSLDVVWCSLVVILIAKKRVVLRRELVSPGIIIGLFFLFISIVYVFRYQSIFYYLWGVRNNFRFYVAFFAFVSFFNEEQVETNFKILEFLFWINAIVSFVQAVLLGYKQDYLGGLFGVEKGCNAFTIVFFSVILTKSILSYMNGKEKTIPVILKCSTALIIAAYAELKFFFVIFMIIMILSFFMTKFSWRKMLMLFFSIVIVSIAGAILPAVFGSSTNISLERIAELITADRYASANDLGRFTAIPTISNRYLKSWPDKLFGRGIGNCETSAFEICNTSFYRKYSYLHYTWFSSAFLFLETGYIGMMFYLLFFVMCLKKSYRMMEEGKRQYCQMAVIISCIAMVLFFYNSSLRTEAAYVIYFVLALPFMKKNKEQERKEYIRCGV